MKKGLTVIIAILLLASCGIETVQQDIRLKPPLGLSVTTNLGGGILLSFWTLNNESYFDSFKIFVTTTSNEAVLDLGSGNYGRGDLISNINRDANNPTLTINNVLPVTSASNISIIIPPEIYFISNHMTWYFFVKSYSSLYTVASKASEVASIFYSNN